MTDSCPRCGSSKVIPIQYGYPAPEAFEAAERGEIVLGGSIVSSENPEWLCASCHGVWRDAETKVVEEMQWRWGDPSFGERSETPESRTSGGGHRLSRDPPSGTRETN